MNSREARLQPEKDSGGFARKQWTSPWNNDDRPFCHTPCHELKLWNKYHSEAKNNCKSARCLFVCLWSLQLHKNDTALDQGYEISAIYCFDCQTKNIIYPKSASNSQEIYSSFFFSIMWSFSPKICASIWLTRAGYVIPETTERVIPWS